MHLLSQLTPNFHEGKYLTTVGRTAGWVIVSEPDPRTQSACEGLVPRLHVVDGDYHT